MKTLYDWITETQKNWGMSRNWNVWRWMAIVKLKKMWTSVVKEQFRIRHWNLVYNCINIDKFYFTLRDVMQSKSDEILMFCMFKCITCDLVTY